MFKKLLNRLASAPSPAPETTSAPASTVAPSPTPGVAPDDIARADQLIAEGNEREDAQDLARAEALYLQATAAAPGHARAWLNLGNAQAARGEFDAAVRAYRTVLDIAPTHASGNYNLARVLFLRGDPARAETCAREALKTRPDFAQAYVILGDALEALGQLEAAADAMRAAVRLQPEDSGAVLNLVTLLFKLDLHDESEGAIRHLLQLQPDHPAALILLSRLLRDHGFVEDALEPLRAALRIDPSDLVTRSEELMLMNFQEGLPVAELFRRHADYGVRTEQAFGARFEHFLGSREPGRRLRVGLVSGDFNAHPVTLFLLPVLERLDRSAFEVVCYSTGGNEDQFTRRVRQASEHWRDAKALSSQQLADAIHADAVDILVDLAGHTTAPRLSVFSQRPAPIQVSWLGYLNTTGLTRMDYRLTDARCDPPESSQPLHTERLVLLPQSQWCYRPWTDAPIDPVAPVERNGYVTFGSFNHSLKVGAALCRRWGELLLQVPRSRLVVAGLGSERKRAAIRRTMAELGVAPDRFDFVPRVDIDKYPALIASVDVSLDTYPYGGGTTTFDALWMGVPVVTATGPTPMSRSAASILLALGLDDWVAPAIDDYVAVAAARAADHQAIAALRRSLRQRLQASPLTDEARFTRDLEAAWRAMWVDYCR